MAKDNEINDSMVDDGPTQQGNHDGDIIGYSDNETLETRTIIYVDGQVRAGEPLVDKVESTDAKEGLKETTEIRYKTASGCGHVLHTGAEAGVACLSCQRLGREPLIICAECSKDPTNNNCYCYICRAPCCYDCRDNRWLDGQMRVVCKACIRSTLRLRILKAIIKWLLIAAGIYYLIMF